MFYLGLAISDFSGFYLHLFSILLNSTETCIYYNSAVSKDRINVLIEFINSIERTKP